MSLLKWATPFEEVDLLRKEMEGLLTTPANVSNGQFNPPVEVVEAENYYRVRILLPGLPAESIGEYIHLEGTPKTLNMSGEIRPAELRPQEKLLLNQFRYGKFFKQLSFPEGIDHENIEARYNQGILDIQLPKAVASQKRSVQIQV